MDSKKVLSSLSILSLTDLLGTWGTCALKIWNIFPLFVYQHMILKKISLFSIVSLLTCSLSLFSPNLKWNTQVSGDAWNHFNLVEGHLNAKMLPLKINFKKYSFRNNTALPLHKNKILSVAANSFLGDSLWKTYDLVCKKKGSLFLKKKSWWENSDRKINALWSEENFNNWQQFSWLITARKLGGFLYYYRCSKYRWVWNQRY